MFGRLIYILILLPVFLLLPVLMSLAILVSPLTWILTETFALDWLLDGLRDADDWLEDLLLN